jgi:hypothetical protein
LGEINDSKSTSTNSTHFDDDNYFNIFLPFSPFSRRRMVERFYRQILLENINSHSIRKKSAAVIATIKSVQMIKCRSFKKNGGT